MVPTERRLAVRALQIVRACHKICISTLEPVLLREKPRASICFVCGTRGQPIIGSNEDYSVRFDPKFRSIFRSNKKPLQR